MRSCSLNIEILLYSLTDISFITARKRSLGQGNSFRSVCQEFCSQRGGGIQAHTQGEAEGSGQGNLPADTRAVSRPTPGFCISQHALRQTYPWTTTGMHSCYILSLKISSSERQALFMATISCYKRKIINSRNSVSNMHNEFCLIFLM